MAEFNFYWPTRLMFGSGRIEDAGIAAREIGRKTLLVSGAGSMRKLGVLDKIIANFRSSGVGVSLFEGIGPNPKAYLIDRGAELAGKENCDFVTGLGGGSVMDAAKGIAISASLPGSVWDYMNSFSEFRKVTSEVLPVMELPTVAGTGSEANGTTVISNRKTKEKSFIKSEFLFPRVSVIDPVLTLTVPPSITGECGVDIISHILEPYLTRGAEFCASERLSEAVMRTVVENLPPAMEDGNNIDARENLSWAAIMGCSPFRGLGLDGSGPVHHIEHAVSGWFDVSHGAGLCALLPHWMEYMKDDIGQRIQQFGEEVFGKKDGIGALKKWLKAMGLERRLSELGVDKNSLEPMAVDTIRVYGKGQDFEPSGPRKLFVEDMVKIYERAF